MEFSQSCGQQGKKGEKGRRGEVGWLDPIEEKNERRKLLKRPGQSVRQSDYIQWNMSHCAECTI